MADANPDAPVRPDEPPAVADRHRALAELLRTLLETGAELRDRIRDQAAVNDTDFRAVGILSHEVAPLPVGELGRRLGLSSAATTAVVDRLESAGHAERVHDPGDRRRVGVVQTAHSRAVALGVLGGFLVRLDRELAHYDEQELETAGRVIATVTDALRASLDPS